MGRGNNGVFEDVIIKIKRKTAAAWAFQNPVLAEGEEGYELDLRGLKIGDGVTPWVGLPYFGGTGAGGTVTSIGATITGTAVSITGSPVTTAGTLALTWTGAVTDFVLGDGSIASISSILGGAGFVPYTGATGTVDLNTQVLLAGPIGGTYLQAFDNVVGSVTVKAENANTSGFSQFNLVNDNSTYRGQFQIKNTTYSFPSNPSVYAANRTYLESDCLKLGIGNYNNGDIFFYTGNGSTLVAIRATITSTGTFEIITPKLGTSSTTGYVWTATGATGNGSWQAPASAALTATYVGYGSGANVLTGSSNFTFDTSGLNIGTSTRTSQRTLRVGTGTDFVDLGQYQASAGYSAIYFNQATPGGTNYGFLGNTTDTYLNAPSTIYLAISDTQKISLTPTRLMFLAGINLEFATVTGSLIGGTTSQKFAFWGKTPIVQPTTGISGAAYSSLGGSAISTNDTFGGYTVSQLAAIIINTGLTA